MFTRKTIFPICLTIVLLLITVGISAADFQGTIGTRFTITDSGFGTKKPQVYIEYEGELGVVKKVHAKVEQWSDTSITCLWTETLSPGIYNLWVRPNIAKTNPIAEGTFTIMLPSIDGVTPDTLTPGATITLKGQFFTSKKPTLYLQDIVSLKKKSCRVVNPTMDSATGASSLNFIVPKWGSGNYEIILQTLVGGASFNVNPPSLDPLDNWHLRYSSPPKSNRMTPSGVTYGNGIFVGVGGIYNFSGETDTILTSPDGLTWTSRNPRTTNGLSAVTYGNGTFVAVGGSILTSSRGMTWTPRNPRITNGLSAVTYGNGTFVAVGASILTSSDGITWTSRISDIHDGPLNGVTYGNGIFVAVGGSSDPIDRSSRQFGTILTSTDGITWTSRNPGTTDGLLGVTYGNGIFLAVGGMYGIDGRVVTSDDGINWTSRTLGTTEPLFDVTYGNGTFVAVGYTILTSTDGITWTSRNIRTTNGLSAVTYGNGTFVAVGFGVIFQSYPVSK